MSRTPLVTVGIVVLVAFAVAVVLAAGTALVAAAGSLAGDIALDESGLDDGQASNETDVRNRTVPGVEADGTANVSAVVESHRSVLADRGYAAVMNASHERNGSVVATDDRSIRSAPNASRVRVTRTQRTSDVSDPTAADRASSATVWSNDSHTVTRQRSDGRERLDVDGRVPLSAVPPTAGPFTTAFGRVDGEFTVTDDRVVDGHRVVTLQAPLESASNETAPGRMRLTVDDRGVIRNGTATWERTDGRIELSYRLRTLDVEDVTKPDWAETAVTASEAREGDEGTPADAPPSPVTG